MKRVKYSSAIQSLLVCLCNVFIITRCQFVQELSLAKLPDRKSWVASHLIDSSEMVLAVS